MDSTFRSRSEVPAPQRQSSYPTLFGVPVYPVDPTRRARHSVYANGQPPAEKKSGRKVVQIPVRFFGSGSDRRSESALRIQKVFRGFFVRKSVRKIKEIKTQVDEIEARLLRDEVVEMIRGNERERLRMSEGLMNLLLRLDGIRGIDLGIRVCRKGVTRKVIGLQEKIDAICAPDSVDDKVEIGSVEVEAAVPDAEFVGIELSPEQNPANADDLGEESKGWNGEVLECEKMKMEGLDVFVASEVNPNEETQVETEKDSKIIEFDGDDVESVKEMLVQYHGKDDPSNGEGKEDDAIESWEFLAYSDDCGEKLCDLREELKSGDTLEVEDKTLEVDAESVDVPVDVVKGSQELKGVKGTPHNFDFGVEMAETTKETMVERNEEDMVVMEKEDHDKRRCELLEQMMEDNKKMMLMMTQLNERNEMQLQMLDALTNRVELLEKAYLCDKLKNSRRKKMKKKNEGPLED